jgi:hypothetical protein
VSFFFFVFFVFYLGLLLLGYYTKVDLLSSVISSQVLAGSWLDASEGKRTEAAGDGRQLLGYTRGSGMHCSPFTTLTNSWVRSLGGWEDGMAPRGRSGTENLMAFFALRAGYGSSLHCTRD